MGGLQTLGFFYLQAYSQAGFKQQCSLFYHAGFNGLSGGTKDYTHTSLQSHPQAQGLHLCFFTITSSGPFWHENVSKLSLSHTHFNRLS